MAVLADDLEVVVAEGIDLVLLSRDEVLIQFGSRSRPSELLRDDELTGLLGLIVEVLRAGRASLADLVGATEPKHQPEVRRVVLDLLERGILTDVRRDPVEQYLAYSFEGSRDFDRLAVTVIGAGPLGARIASILTLHPLGAIKLLDNRMADEAWRASLPSWLGTHTDGHGRVDSLVGSRLRPQQASVEVVDGDLDLEGVRRAVAASDLTLWTMGFNSFGPRHTIARMPRNAVPKPPRGGVAAGWSRVLLQGDYGYHRLDQTAGRRAFESWMGSQRGRSTPLSSVVLKDEDLTKVWTRAYNRGVLGGIGSQFEKRIFAQTLARLLRTKQYTPELLRLALKANHALYQS